MGRKVLLRNQVPLIIEATETIQAAPFYFIPVGDWYKHCGCVGA